MAHAGPRIIRSWRRVGRRIGLVLVAASLPSAFSAGQDAAATAGCRWDKVWFDLSALDADGLIGPADGKRYLDFEFCAPARRTTLAQLKSIAPELDCYRQSPGRSGCGVEQTLCIGSSVMAEFRATLCRLSALPYVRLIQRTWWE